MVQQRNENINAQGQKVPKCQGRADLDLNEKGITFETSEIISYKRHFILKIMCFLFAIKFY